MKIQVNHLYYDDVVKISSIAGEKKLTGELKNDIIFFEKQIVLKVSYDNKSKIKTLFLPMTDNEIRYANRRILIEFFTEFFELSYPYGVLLGIRPIKLLRKILRTNLSQKGLFVVLRQSYLISEKIIKKLFDIYKVQEKFLIKSEKFKKSVYFSVPFCPSRCSYCSFVSNDINDYINFLDPYLEAAENELKEKIKNIDTSDIDCLYIGGGTPASPNLDYIKRLIKTLGKFIDFSKLKEFTFEAGRPDVLDIKKLKYLKSAGVSRICINPQTMNNDTLKKIGRKHSVDDFVKVFNIARNLGFCNINTDIILGLPDESAVDMLNTAKKIIYLNPENITIHSLSIKKGSKLSGEEDIISSEILSVYDKITNLLKNNYKEYYLYRQKNIMQNLDNVGYSKSGFECIYNIRMMEEEHEIIGIGAGSTSKIFTEKKEIKTLINPKNLKTYIDKYLNI